MFTVRRKVRTVVAVTLVLWWAICLSTSSATTATTTASRSSSTGSGEEDVKEIPPHHLLQQPHHHHHHQPNSNSQETDNVDGDERQVNPVSQSQSSVTSTAGTIREQETVGWAELVEQEHEEETVPRANGNGDDNANNKASRAHLGEQGERPQPFFPPRTDSFWKRPRVPSNRNKPKGEQQGGRENVSPTTSENESQERKKKRPNIILIITDDQDVELGSMNFMPETLKVFKNEGIEFRHGYCSTPMCCPSRSSLLTGLYVHNHQVYTNNDNCSSVLWREKFEKRTFASYLWSSGYYTSYIGKYLNKYDGVHIPYGWSEWNTLLMNSRFYNYTLNRNGKKIRYGNDYEHDYYPDSIANDTMDFLRRMAEDERIDKPPFLLVASFPSPHGPEDSAPQYSDLFFNVTTHHTPSYNHAPNTDKQWILRVTNKMTPILKDFTNLLMTKRLQTLQSVDVAVKAIFDKLKETNLAEETYVFYTSDHGYHVGQFGLVKGKSMPYEFDIRVPFFLAAPKGTIIRGSTVLEPVLNIDLAPTFLDLANIPIPEHMDGRSLVPLIEKYSPNYRDDGTFVWKDTFLIESSGRRELPVSGTPSPASLVKGHTRKKQKEREGTKFAFVDNETVRINDLCSSFNHPCLPGQKKYCRKEKNRVRFRKCRQNIDFIAGNNEEGTEPGYQFGDNPDAVSGVMIGNKCRCRYKRSEGSSDFDWDVERRKIDEEIEILKQKIESLRQRRREMRRKWIAEVVEPKIPLLKPKKKLGNGSTSNVQPTHRISSTTTSPSRTFNSEDTFAGGEDSEDYDEIHDKRRGSYDGSEDLDMDVPIFHHSDEIDEDEGDDADDLDDNEDLPSRYGNTSNWNSEDDFPMGSSNDSSHYENYNESSGGRWWDDNLNLKFSDEDDDDIIAYGTGDDDGGPYSPSNTNGRKPNRGRHRNKLHGRGKYGARLNHSENRDSLQKCDCFTDPRWVRQREREDRKRKKLLSKLRKKQRFLNRINDPVERHLAETCGTEEKMNCFWHDNDHWRTAPLWTSGSFCFCMNSNNNTYSCLRSVNSTHNYLYCQFITGFKMYFDLKQDPYELQNLIGSLPAKQEDWMLGQLIRLKKCQGKDECWANNTREEETLEPSIWEQIFGRWRRKKKRGGRRKTQ